MATKNETPYDHVVNALAIMQGYRELHGGGWLEALNDPRVSIAELAANLEAVEARLKLTLEGLLDRARREWRDRR